MDLKKALTAFRNTLQAKRVLYVIQANLDLGKVTKFGIAGMDSGNPFSRPASVQAKEEVRRAFGEDLVLM